MERLSGTEAKLSSPQLILKTEEQSLQQSLAEGHTVLVLGRSWFPGSPASVYWLSRLTQQVDGWTGIDPTPHERPTFRGCFSDVVIQEHDVVSGALSGQPEGNLSRSIPQKGFLQM